MVVEQLEELNLEAPLMVNVKSVKSVSKLAVETKGGNDDTEIEKTVTEFPTADKRNQRISVNRQMSIESTQM